jgi:hypothetical protein
MTTFIVHFGLVHRQDHRAMKLLQSLTGATLVTRPRWSGPFLRHHLSASTSSLRQGVHISPLARRKFMAKTRATLAEEVSNAVTSATI